MITNEGCVIDMVFSVAFRLNSMADPQRNPSPKDKMLGKAPTESSPPLFNNGPKFINWITLLAATAYMMTQFLHFGSPKIER